MSSDHSYDPRDDDLPSDDSDVPDVLQNLPPLMSISQDLPQLSQDSAPGEVVSLATDLSQIVSDVFLIPRLLNQFLLPLKPFVGNFLVPKSVSTRVIYIGKNIQ